MDQNLENKRKKLIFRSWHRGTREMDLILGSFADRYVPGFSAGELEEYENILECSDPDLYNWMTGQKAIPDNLLTKLIKILLTHKTFD